MTVLTVPVRPRGKLERMAIDPKLVLAGKPWKAARNDHANPKGSFLSGLWGAGKGRWAIDYAFDEFVVLLAGKVKLIAADGKAKTYKAGNAFVIPKGFKGSWETLEPIRMYYAIAKSAGRPGPEVAHSVPVKPRGGTVEKEAVPAKKVVAGTPMTTTRNDYSNAKGKFHCGVWTATKGTWKVNYTLDEFILLLAGKMKLTAQDGSTKSYKAGDAFVIPKGFKGVWETQEPLRKYYAIAE